MKSRRVRNNERKEQAARDAELKRFASESTVSVWKSHGSTFTDYESKVTKGLILRVEDCGEKAEKWPNVYRNRVVRSWVLQCGGKYPIEIGGFYWVRFDGARATARLLRAGDEREIVNAYLTNTEFGSRDSEDQRSLLRVAGLGRIEQMIARDRAWFKSIARESGARWFAYERRRVRHTESLLNRVRAFMGREGLKIRRAKRIAEPGTGPRRAA